MKSLKESILDDIETTMNTGQQDVIIDMLFDKDDSTRQNGIDILYKTVIETTMNTGANDVIIDMLFNKDINKRRQGFEQLRSMVESYHPKEQKTTAKMKNSDSYFVEFTWQLENLRYGFAKICDWISYMQICKRTGLSYRTTYINASENKFGDKIDCVEEEWRSTQPNFNPKAPNVKLYEVPEGLNDLFKRIQMEAYKHR